MKKWHLFLFKFTFFNIVAFQCFASESDPYTFSQVFLNDSAPLVNALLEVKIKSAIDEINSESLNLSDNESISQLMRKLYTKPTTGALLPGGGAALHRAIIGEWEECIRLNNCKGWPKFERILLLAGETIFDESDYNSVTRMFAAPILNICGVRMGADKLTHMFDDGMGKFDLWLSKNYSMDQIYATALRAEFELMGARYSEVASPADVEAEIAGIRFFHDLLLNEEPFVCMDSATRKFQIKKQIDICKYINQNFDERIIKNIYTGNKKYELYDAINKRKKDNKFYISEDQRIEILSRKRELPDNLTGILNSLSLLFKPSQVPDFLQSYPYWGIISDRKSPDFKVSRNISICKTDKEKNIQNANWDQFFLSSKAKNLYQRFENLRISNELIGRDGTLSGPAVEELKNDK